MAVEPRKRVDPHPGEFAAFGPFRLFPDARLLERDGTPVEVGGRALDVLIALVEQAGQVVGKIDLMSSVWRDITVVEGVLRTHVYNLRKALGDGVGGARYVKSVPGRGYCFVAPVVRGATEATSSSSTWRAGQAAAITWRLPHGLPPRLARMTGRDETVRTLVAQLLEHRFVTILGAAGIGKTTVAVSVGHTLLEDFGGAVRFIELGSVTDAALVAVTVATTLGLQVHADDALHGVEAFLRDKRVLLVLDNCEHLADAAAQLAEHLFLHAPRVHLLTTTRETLRVEGERVHRLGSLDTPATYQGMSTETIQTFPAVQVFLECAAASGWSSDLADNDVPVIAGICQRLDGVALAIELAASFVGECGLQGTAAMLDDRVRLLWQHGRRTAPPRQQTIHALIAWSYDRLRERERVVVRRSSIFFGTFSIDDADSVVRDAGDDAPLLESVNELVAKSLLSSTVEDGLVVYRMLETTRVYALEQLAESGERERVSLRHASFYTDRLAQAARTGRPFRRQASDLANVRAALQWCFSSPAVRAAGARLAAAAARMPMEEGLGSECLLWCGPALDVIDAPDAYAGEHAAHLQRSRSPDTSAGQAIVSTDPRDGWPTDRDPDKMRQVHPE